MWRWLRPPFALLAFSLACLIGVAPVARADQSTAASQAKVLYARSVVAYRAKDFAEAVRLLRAAYQLTFSPVLLYNLARALEGQGLHADALVEYHAYLDGSPLTVANRADVQQRIAALEHQIAEEDQQRRDAVERDAEEKAAAQRAREEAEARELASKRVALAPTPPPAPAPIRSNESAARRAAPWIVAGVGGVVLVTGIAIGGVALHDRNEAAADTGLLPAQQTFSTAKSLSTGANVCFGVGGVIAGAGLVWGVIEAIHRRHDGSHEVATARSDGRSGW